MNETREQVGARTSARDPIDRWLDVFIRLLRVPRGDAERIRDELEDHLRARVDDLMVTGLSEPEAVRAAVAELGETADLAKQFKSAVHSRRRPVMQTVLVGVAGAAVAMGSLAVLGPRGSGPGVVASPAAQADAASAGEPATFAADLPVDPDTGYTTLADAIAAIQKLLDAPVIVHHRPMVANLGATSTDVEFPAPGLRGLTLEQGLEQLSVPLELGPSDSLAVYRAGDAFELSTQSFFDRRDAVLLEYDVTRLLEPPTGGTIEPLVFRDTVTDLIEPAIWGERARIGMVSSTMLVSAHPRVHSQIADLFARIEARYDEQRASQLEADLERHREAIVTYTAEVGGRERGLSELADEFEEAHDARRAARERYYRMELELDRADEGEIVGFRLEMAEARDALNAADSRVADVMQRLERARQSLAVTKGQIRQHESYLAAMTGPAD